MADNKNHNKIIFTFFFILLIGFLLRILFLDKYPVGFTSNEALVGWRALSLSQTGLDETGRKWPLVFSSLNGYQLPGATYLLVPIVRWLELNENTVRLPFAFLGTLSIIAIFFSLKKFFPNNINIALWGMFVFVINPWGLFFSRIVSSSGLALSSFIIGFALLLWSDFKKDFVLLAALFLSLSVYADKLAWYFIPGFLFFYYLYSKRKEVLLVLAFVILTLLPLLNAYFTSPQFTTDFINNDVKVVNDLTLLNGISLLRGEDISSGSPILGKLFYNKLLYITKILENFIKHFNPRFYFANGEQNTLHGLSNFGPILLVFFPFFLFAIWKLVKEKHQNLKIYAGWFIFAIIPSALSIPSPDQEKSLFLLPVLVMILSYGLAHVKKKSIMLLFGLLLAFNLSVVFYDGIIKEPRRFEEKWQHGYKQLANTLFDKLDDYENIYISDSYGADPGPALLFYLNYSPSKYLSENRTEFRYRNWVTKIGNIQVNQKDTWNKNGQNLFVYSLKDKEFEETNQQNTSLWTIDNLKKEKIFVIYGNEKNK